MKFEIGKTYTTRMIGDSDIVLRYTVLKRTEKMVTFRDHFGKVSRAKVRDLGDGEFAFPDGIYSMAPVVRAK